MTNLERFFIEENRDFIVLNKPCELSVQDQAGSLGLINLLRLQFPGQDFFPVHRLDKPTSGLLIVAKNSEANSLLSNAFEQRKVEKYYWAISNKKPRKKQGAVIGDMAKARGGSWKLMRSTDNPTRTYFFSFALADGLRAYVLKPYTGKTHQLRVALKSLGAAILGDERYGGEVSDRLYLHAASLAFKFKDRHFQLNVPPNSGQHFLAEPFQALLTRSERMQDLSWPAVK